MTDHQLLEAYAQGNEPAFETLVQKYFRMVYTVAARQTGDAHLGEEIAQSVFLILSRKARGFPPNGSVPGWLLRSTRFVCLDAIKMRRRREENERKLVDTVDQQPVTTAPAHTMEWLLDEAIQALRPDEQAGIVAHFFEGKNFQELAEMFAITEHAARKRTSRCLAKLQNFMERRGAKAALPALTGLLLAQRAHQPTSQALLTAAWKGKAVAGSIAALADRTERLLQWRRVRRVGMNVAALVVLLLAGVWTMRELNPPVAVRIQRLGRAWGGLDEVVARHRQFLMQTAPNSPDFQARVQQELGTISRESSRIIGGLSPLLVPPEDRRRLTEFFVAELDETLKLDDPTRTAVFGYIYNRVAQDQSLNAALKALAEGTKTEAGDIKALLSPEQRQRFDQIYGVEGETLFSYAQAVGLGKVGN